MGPFGNNRTADGIYAVKFVSRRCVLYSSVKLCDRFVFLRSIIVFDLMVSVPAVANDCSGLGFTLTYISLLCEHVIFYVQATTNFDENMFLLVTKIEIVLYPNQFFDESPFAELVVPWSSVYFTLKMHTRLIGPFVLVLRGGQIDKAFISVY